MIDSGRSSVPALGDIHQPSGRSVLQSLDDVELLRDTALRNASELQKIVAEATKTIQGATSSRIRDVKSPERIQRKIQQGKPPCTIGDYLATRIIIDNPEAYRQVIARLRLRKVIEEDDFLECGKAEKGGYRAHKFQIVVAEGFSAEVQLVPREVYE